jgi:hypothetical protein
MGGVNQAMHNFLERGYQSVPNQSTKAASYRVTSTFSSLTLEQVSFQSEGRIGTLLLREQSKTTGLPP